MGAHKRGTQIQSSAGIYWESSAKTRQNRLHPLCERKSFSRKLQGNKHVGNYQISLRYVGIWKPKSWLSAICLIIAINFIIRNFHSLFISWNYFYHQTISDFFIFLAAHKFHFFMLSPLAYTRFWKAFSMENITEWALKLCRLSPGRQFDSRVIFSTEK